MRQQHQYSEKKTVKCPVFRNRHLAMGTHIVCVLSFNFFDGVSSVFKSVWWSFKCDLKYEIIGNGEPGVKKL